MATTVTGSQATGNEPKDHKHGVISDATENLLQRTPLARWATISVLIAAITVSSLYSTAFEPALPYVMRAFNESSDSLATFTVSSYVLGYVFGPLVVAPASEVYGRLWVLHIGATAFIVCLIVCGFSNSIGLFLFFRVIMGFAGVDLVLLGPAVVADLIPKEQRGLALSAMSVGPCVGPTLGPLVGGFIVESLEWRWIFWIGTIVMAVCWVPAVFVLRESFPPVLKAKAAKKERERRAAQSNDPLIHQSEKAPGSYSATVSQHQTPQSAVEEPTASAGQTLKRAWTRPIKILIRSPIVLLVAIYTSLINSYLQIYFATIGTVFQEQYGFSPGQSGLAYLGMTVGFLFCQLTLGGWADRHLRWMERRRGGVERAENRLPLLAVGAVAMPLGICLYAWTVQFHTHWIVPIIGTSFIAIGVLWGYLPCMFYLVDVYPVYAASAIGGATIIRSIVSAVLPLAADPIFTRLGFGWGNTMLAGLTVAFVPLAVYLYKHGERLRLKSQYDPAS